MHNWARKYIQTQEALLQLKNINFGTSCQEFPK